MTTFIQITDTNNDILQVSPFNNVTTSTVSTVLFRVWNNQPQHDGVQALNSLKLDLMYPPLQGITTLALNDVIQIRCVYSGELSKSITSSFQTFPITDSEFDRLESNTYNEYELQIDFSTLTQLQIDNILTISMKFNVTASWDEEFASLSIPFERMISSNSSIIFLGREIMDTLSDTLILWEGIHVVADIRVLVNQQIDTSSDTLIV